MLATTTTLLGTAVVLSLVAGVVKILAAATRATIRRRLARSWEWRA